MLERADHAFAHPREKADVFHRNCESRGLHSSGFTVQRYLWPLWHDVLSTSDRAKAYALKANVGEKMRVVLEAVREDDR